MHPASSAADPGQTATEVVYQGWYVYIHRLPDRVLRVHAYISSAAPCHHICIVLKNAGKHCVWLYLEASSTVFTMHIGLPAVGTGTKRFFSEASQSPQFHSSRRRNRDFPTLAAYGSPPGPLLVRSSAGAQNPTVGSRSLFRHGLQSYQSLTSCLSNRCVKIVQPGVTSIFMKVSTGRSR